MGEPMQGPPPRRLGPPHRHVSAKDQRSVAHAALREAELHGGLRALRISERCPDCSSELVLRDRDEFLDRAHDHHHDHHHDRAHEHDRVLECSAMACGFSEPAERRMARLMDRTLSLQRQVVALGGDVLKDFR